MLLPSYPRPPIRCTVDTTDYPSVSGAFRALGLYQTEDVRHLFAVRRAIKAGKPYRVGVVEFRPVEYVN